MRALRTSGFSLSVTPYAGRESEVLRLRNANRPEAQSARYLDWRYARSAGSPEPEIFWIGQGSGRLVGMASLIYRLFWLGNEPQYVAVLGDISLDTGFRGRGLGRALLEFVTESLDRNHPDSLAFVIPNQAAERILASLGWARGGRLIPHVLVLNAESKLRQAVRIPSLARAMAWPAKKLVAGIARMQRKRGYSLSIIGEPADSFEALWRSRDKTNVVLGDRGIGTLTWRYVNHPLRSFRFSRLDQDGALAGYLVYDVSAAHRECSVYDLMLRERGDLGCMLALFVEHIAAEGGIDLIRILLNEGHPYAGRLWRLGFVPREQSGSFQLYGKSARSRLGECGWFLTYGDKDI